MGVSKCTWVLEKLHRVLVGCFIHTLISDTTQPISMKLCERIGIVPFSLRSKDNCGHNWKVLDPMKGAVQSKGGSLI